MPNRENEREQERWRNEGWRGPMTGREQEHRGWEDRDEDMRYGRYGGGYGREEYGRQEMGKTRDMSDTWRRWGGDHGSRDERSFGERVRDFFGMGGRRQHGRAPKGYVRSDERIREDVCDRLMSMPYIDVTQVEIHVKDGEVTLEGNVSSRDEKRYVEDIAEEVLGVKDVNNRIRVQRPEDRQQITGTQTTRPKA